MLLLFFERERERDRKEQECHSLYSTLTRVCVYRDNLLEQFTLYACTYVCRYIMYVCVRT